MGDKLPESELTEVRAALETLKNTVAHGSTEDIKRDTEALEKAFYAVSEKLYAQANPQGAQGAENNPGDGAQGGNGTYYDNGNGNN